MTDVVPSFELAGGSVIGSDHRVVPKNNQDAWHVARTADVAVGVVCDGCGSGPYTEVGAWLGARILSASLVREMTAFGRSWYWADRMIWARVERDLLAAIHVLAAQMGGDYLQTINDYFLFTIAGVAIGGNSVAFFGLGDGVFMADGQVLANRYWPDNAPPYLAYNLTGMSTGAPYRIDFLERFGIDDVQDFLVGCDGAGTPGLLQVCQDGRNYPGMDKPIGSISQFWEDDVIYRNPDALRRRLKMIGRDWHGAHGLLADDTTIIVGRRVREQASVEALFTDGTEIPVVDAPVHREEGEAARALASGDAERANRLLVSEEEGRVQGKHPGGYRWLKVQGIRVLAGPGCVDCRQRGYYMGGGGGPLSCPYCGPGGRGKRS